MKKALRISISILLFALAVAITQIPADPVSADTTKASEGDFQIKDNILVKYTGTAQVVSVPAYVTRIGDEAFAGHDEMEEVRFEGDKLEEISYCAFAGCDGLTKVTLPDSLITLGNGAFSRCASLKEVKLGNSLKDIGIGCFANCPQLSVLTVASKNTYFMVKDGCLYDDEIKKLYLVLPGRKSDFFSMPSTVEDVDAYAFWGSKEIKSVGLGSKLKSIPDYAFSNCKSLEEITIPLSVRRIGIKAFEDCVKLKKVVIPISVTDIHETAFDGCRNLEMVTQEGTYAYRYYQDYLANREILGEEEQQENIHVEEPVLTTPSEYYDPDKDQILGGTFVVGNNAIVFIDSVKSDSSLSETKDDGEETEEILIEKNKDIPKFTVFNEILADYAFYKDTTLRDYEFEEDIKEIGRFSFARSNLDKIHIPFGVTKIGYGAFYHCDRLQSVFVPGSVKEIEPKAFENTPWLDNWRKEEGEDFLIVGDGILLAYRGKESSIRIPDTVKTIGSYAFGDNHFVTTVTIPDSVKTIGEGAFYNCSNLQLVEGAENVTRIGDKAFLQCDFHEFHVKETIEELGYMAVSADILVFDSKDRLPKASYEETRVYLNEGRTAPYLGDVGMVLVRDNFTLKDFEDTVLATDKNLLKGVIAGMDEEKGEARILYSGYTPEEYERALIPTEITVGEKSFTVLGASDVSSFSDFITEADALYVKNNSSFIESADILEDGIKGSFTLEISDESDYQKVKDAYKEVYRTVLPENLHCVDIRLTDMSSLIPVKYFGSHNFSIKITIPKEYNNSSLRILTVDANGQLENVSYRREEDNLIVELKHLSPFVFYATEKESNLYGKGTVYGGQTTITGFHKIDNSPDTGDRIHPKFFLSAALVALGIANLLVKRKRKIK